MFYKSTSTSISGHDHTSWFGGVIDRLSPPSSPLLSLIHCQPISGGVVGSCSGTAGTRTAGTATGQLQDYSQRSEVTENTVRERGRTKERSCIEQRREGKRGKRSSCNSHVADL